ncbi:hypothetical protein CCH79_00018601 [Gambusia affinis]|uniref:PDZ domain-containing protein n=1 Tax=Gambusia affinis TaxID=33528 RepID=A0A315VLT0_GAMAF|nr:hypothetical protein CCH79_00018601 [Gambusia affinis]
MPRQEEQPLALSGGKMCSHTSKPTRTPDSQQAVINNNNTLLVVLNKEEGAGLGFSVAGGADIDQKKITNLERPCRKTSAWLRGVSCPPFAVTGGGKQHSTNTFCENGILLNSTLWASEQNTSKTSSIYLSSIEEAEPGDFGPGSLVQFAEVVKKLLNGKALGEDEIYLE